MAGQIKNMIDKIITERAKGNSTIAMTTRTKILMKGVDPEAYQVDSEDDPLIIQKLTQIGADLGVMV